MHQIFFYAYFDFEKYILQFSLRKNGDKRNGNFFTAHVALDRFSIVCQLCISLDGLLVHRTLIQQLKKLLLNVSFVGRKTFRYN